MRLLFVAPFLPDPLAAHGGGIYLGTLCAAMAARAELGLVAPLRADEMARASGPVGTFRFVQAVPHPERPSGAALLGHKATMLFRWGLRGMPLVAAKQHSRAMANAVRTALAEFRPDAVLVELAQCAQYLPLLDAVPTIFTDHEAGVPANAHTDLGAWADRRDARLWQRYVQRLYPHARLLQAVTPEDATALQQLLGRSVAVRLPVTEVRAAPTDCSAAPPRALFLGNFSHRPNPEAARVLADSVLPLLQKQDPRIELWLAGPNGERLADLAGRPGVRVLGYVPDLAQLFAQVRVLLAPLYSGSGFRMKGLSALAHGVPVVTNALGARGLAVPPPARRIAESAADLAAATLPLLLDRAAVTTAGRAAHAWALQNLAPAAVADGQLQRVTQLLARS